MTVRNARRKDFADILRIYARAREYMKQSGNPTQWGTAFPPETLIRDDIREKRNYVVETESGVHGVFAFIEGEDPTYARIEGAWRSDAPYGTIHRIASDGEVKGVLRRRSHFAKRTLLISGSIRTKTMQRCAARSKKRALKSAASST